MKDLKKFYKYLDKINDLEYVLGILDWESKMNLPSKNISEVSRLMLEYNMKIFKLKIIIYKELKFTHIYKFTSYSY